MTDHPDFDLAIIGSGSGNSIPESVAERWKIAVIERGTFGGTCLNVGCIPSKMFVLPADLAVGARRSQRLGVSLSVDAVDWPAIRDRVFGRIDPIAEGGRDYRATGHPNITLIEGTATFTGPRTLAVDGQPIRAERILVAAGARPSAPPIEGLSETRFHTSDTVMRLDRLPERLAVIGGGFIATEMSHVFSGLGSNVTLFNRSSLLLRSHDPDLAETFTKLFADRVDVRLEQLPERIEEVGGQIELTVNGKPERFDELLVATGRTPNSDLVQAEQGGLEIDDGGRIVVDATMATSVEGVWAIGDVANSFQLKHLANREAAVAFHNMTNPDDLLSVDYGAVPQAVFSNPQIASVGLTEPEAVAAGRDVVVGRRDYGGTAYGWALEDESSFAKVLIDRGSKQIVGAHILGPQASSLIQPLIQAMTLGTPADVIANEVFYIHPALTEVVENALLDGLSRV